MVSRLHAFDIPRDVIDAERRVSDWMGEQGHTVWELGYSRNRYPALTMPADCGEAGHDDGCCGNLQCLPRNVRLSHDGAAAVDPDYYWRDMATCPRGVKVQLLNAGAVAIYAQFDGSDPQWLGWAPLPKVRKS